MDEKLASTLAKNLVRYRKLRQWTQRDLGQLLDVDHSVVARWETGKVFPRSKTLQKIAETLETTVEELMTGTETSSLASVLDPEMLELFHQIPMLETHEQQALKTVLEGMLTRHRLKKMIKAS
jgi:transcriptional regulator with XRE-family HTH domain